MTMQDSTIPVRVDIDGMAAIGRTRADIVGIRLVESEGGSAPAPAPATPAPATPAAAPAPAQSPAGGTPTPPAGAQAPEAPAINSATGQPYTPAETRDYIASLRQESKSQRETREAAEQRATAAEQKSAAILKAAGFNPDGTAYTELDANAIAAQKAISDTQRDDTIRENLVLRSVGTAIPGTTINGDKLLDSRSFLNKLSSIKVDDRASVETLIKEFVSNDESYRVTSAAASSGGTQHTGTQPTNARKSLAEALDEKLPKGTNSRK